MISDVYILLVDGIISFKHIYCKVGINKIRIPLERYYWYHWLSKISSTLSLAIIFTYWHPIRCIFYHLFIYAIRLKQLKLIFTFSCFHFKIVAHLSSFSQSYLIRLILWLNHYSNHLRGGSLWTRRQGFEHRITGFTPKSSSIKLPCLINHNIAHPCFFIFYFFYFFNVGTSKRCYFFLFKQPVTSTMTIQHKWTLFYVNAIFPDFPRYNFVAFSKTLIGWSSEKRSN